MSNLNVVVLQGNMVKDPALRATPAGTKVCDFTVANNRGWKDAQGKEHEGVTFIDCVAWGKLGEVLAQHKRKGDEVTIHGHLQQDKWEDKETGEKRSKIKLVADEIHFGRNARKLTPEDEAEAEKARKRDMRESIDKAASEKNDASKE